MTSWGSVPPEDAEIALNCTTVVAPCKASKREDREGNFQFSIFNSQFSIQLPDACTLKPLRLSFPARIVGPGKHFRFRVNRNGLGRADRVNRRQGVPPLFQFAEDPFANALLDL